MIRLVWRGTEIRVEFSFFLVAALAGILGGTGFFLSMFLACLLHELGHLLALYWFHLSVRQVTICGFGVLLRPDGGLASYGQDVAVLLSGPLVNLMMACLCWCWGIDTAWQMHLALGLFNLLPYPQLDGGSAGYALLCGLGVAPMLAQRIQMIAAALCTACLIAAMIYTQQCSLSLVAMLVYLTLWAPLQERLQK